jgi:sulfide:quinone oxidoreductase
MAGEPPFRSQPARVLVAGGGLAGVETVLALHKTARHRAEVELLAPDRELLYRPLLVAEPFGAGSVQRFPLEQIVDDQGARLRTGRLVAVDVSAHAALDDSGERLPYDALVVATGARTAEAVPGALAFDGPRAVEPMRDLVERATRGGLATLAFALPEPAAGWPLPLYELALMTAARAPAVEIVLATAERAPLEMFGHEASESVRRRLEAAGIQLRTGTTPLEFAGGQLRLADGDLIAADAAVALPRLEGEPIEGLPHTAGGFLPIDERCRVVGAADVYAVGDIAAFPLKQGGLAVRQAQTVADHVAARAGAPVRPEPFEPLLRGMLLTGAAPSYLQSGPGESLAADAPLWWPPTKVADSYLLPYLVTRFQLSVAAVPTAGGVDLVSSAPAGEPVPSRPGRRDG